MGRGGGSEEATPWLDSSSWQKVPPVTSEASLSSREWLSKCTDRQQAPLPEPPLHTGHLWHVILHMMEYSHGETLSGWSSILHYKSTFNIVVSNPLKWLQLLLIKVLLRALSNSGYTHTDTHLLFPQPPKWVCQTELRLQSGLGAIQRLKCVCVIYFFGPQLIRDVVVSPG